MLNLNVDEKWFAKKKKCSLNPDKKEQRVWRTQRAYYELIRSHTFDATTNTEFIDLHFVCTFLSHYSIQTLQPTTIAGRNTVPNLKNVLHSALTKLEKNGIKFWNSPLSDKRKSPLTWWGRLKTNSMSIISKRVELHTTLEATEANYFPSHSIL